jgi:hypothetical protein
MNRISIIILALLFNSHAPGLCQDVITFKTGNRVECKVISYDNNGFSVRLPSGGIKQAPIVNIGSIAFGESDASPVDDRLTKPETNDETAASPIPQVILADAKPTTDQGRTQVFNQGIRLTIKKYDNKISMESDMSRYFRKKGVKAVGANVLVENKSDKPIGVYWGSFKIRDQDANIYESSLYASGPRPYLDFTTVQPGDKIAAWIFFEVSPGIVMEKSSIRYDKVPNGYSPDSLYSDWFPVGAVN